ncbi:MAG: dTDP-4-dehydrorhamnose reductase [Tistlia sp.]|uniref:dTDP-4-dehydrorhamnose reductase n=1 Tax=Tistlia sp. TaxID=3057121 RepID=UPI0034A42093
MSGAVLLFGGAGQVGRELAALAASRGVPLVAPAREAVDLCDRAAVEAELRRDAPAVVVNAAAYTAVDKAESEQEEALRVNRDGAATLAAAAAAADLPFVHLSTDYVFDGSAREPYREDAPVSPLSAYGRSKEAGERAVREVCPRHVILRTAWVFSPFRSNFVKTMLRLGAERPELRIVDDQLGCPTAAADIAAAVLTIAEAVVRPGFSDWGTYHFVGAERMTWFGFARRIFELARAEGRPVPALAPITTPEYPTPAPRPAYSVLDTTNLGRVFGIQPPPLADSLRQCVVALLEQQTGERSG